VHVGRLLIALSSLIVVLTAGAARGATVAILEPASPPPLLVEALLRLQGELASVGFAMEVVRDTTAPGSATPLLARIETLAARAGLDAVIGFDIPPMATTPASIHVCVVDKQHARTLARSVSLAGAELPASALAIRAIELLRSSLLESDWTAAPRQTAAAPTGAEASSRTVVASSAPPNSAASFEVALGAGALVRASLQQGAVAPLLRVGWAATETWLVGLTLSGLGSRPRFTTATGSGDVAQTYAVAELLRRFRPGRRLQPFAALAAGVLVTTAHGAPTPPNQGRDVSQWSALFEASAGARLPLGARLFVGAAGNMLLAEPYPVLRFAGQDVAAFAHPAFLFSLWVGARL